MLGGIEAEGLPLFDVRGDAFALLRGAGLSFGIWRISTRVDLDRVEPDSPLLLAVYADDDLDQERTLLQRHPTLVVGVGLGEWYGSVALSRGAVGYCRAELDPPALREAITEGLGRAISKARDRR